MQKASSLPWLPINKIWLIYSFTIYGSAICKNQLVWLDYLSTRFDLSIYNCFDWLIIKTIVVLKTTSILIYPRFYRIFLFFKPGNEFVCHVRTDVAKLHKHIKSRKTLKELVDGITQHSLLAFSKMRNAGWLNCWLLAADLLICWLVNCWLANLRLAICWLAICWPNILRAGKLLTAELLIESYSYNYYFLNTSKNLAFKN